MAYTQTDELTNLIKARYPIIRIESPEEARIVEILGDVAHSRKSDLVVWSSTRGIDGDSKLRDPIKLMDHIAGISAKKAVIVVVKDFDPFLKDFSIRRRLKDLVPELRSSKTTVILLSASFKIPADLVETLSTSIEWGRPERDEIRVIAKRLLSSCPKRVSDQVSESDIDAAVEASLGLTAVNVENVLSKSLIRTKTFDPAIIIDEKRTIIKQTGILEFFPHSVTMSDIGGMDSLKEWLHRRQRAFTPEAAEFGLTTPKGALLLGVPGTGKSMTAKAVGALLGMPLLRLDMGRVFGGLVGESERNLREMISVVESIAPAVLWIDEIDKGLSGSSSSGRSDGGTTARVFGSFITWMQEKTAPVFVVATANDVNALPPEILRKGRFDEIFFCDLPDESDRETIWRIHLERVGRDPSKLSVKKLAAESNDFSGAEIAETVQVALYDAFDAGKKLGSKHLLKAISDTVPLAVTMSERIDEMRTWAETRARMASGKRRGHKTNRVTGTDRQVELD
jgi:AAA+ superfamily predicted ATPase